MASWNHFDFVVKPQQAQLPRVNHASSRKASLSSFQEAVLDALAARTAGGWTHRFILGQAPTSGGKTHLLGEIPTDGHNTVRTKRFMIATFPTNALVVDQARALGAVVIGRASVGLASQPAYLAGDEIIDAMVNAKASGKPVVCSPDALYLLCQHPIRTLQAIPSQAMEVVLASLSHKYTKGKSVTTRRACYKLTADSIAKRDALLLDAVIVFDEQHAIAEQTGAMELMGRLLALPDTQILMLSGTPIIPKLWSKAGLPAPLRIEFDACVAKAIAEGAPVRPLTPEVHLELVALTAGSSGCGVFNDINPGDAHYPLNWNSATDAVYPGRHINRYEALDRLELAFHLGLQSQRFSSRILRWDGWFKSKAILNLFRKGNANAPLPEDAVILGTSALDLGVDPRVRNLWGEFRYADEAIQAIGRLARPTGFSANGWTRPHATSKVTIVLPKALSNTFIMLYNKWHQAEGGTPVFERHELKDLLLQAGLLESNAEPTHALGLFLRRSDRETRMAIIMKPTHPGVPHYIIRATVSIFRVAMNILGDGLTANPWPKGRAEQVEALVRSGADRAVAREFVKQHGHESIITCLSARIRPERLRCSMWEGRKSGFHVWEGLKPGTDKVLFHFLKVLVNAAGGNKPEPLRVAKPIAVQSAVQPALPMVVSDDAVVTARTTIPARLRKLARRPRKRTHHHPKRFGVIS
jgi:hypothetical protein